MFKTNKEKIVSVDLALKITFTMLALALIYLVPTDFIVKGNVSIAVLIALVSYHLIRKTITYIRLRHVLKVSNINHKIEISSKNTITNEQFSYSMDISIILQVFRDKFYVKMIKEDSSESRSFNSYIKFDDSDENKFSVIFNYENKPYKEVAGFLSHIGTGELCFSDGKLVSLYYFNDPVKRATYGSMIKEKN